MKGASINSRDKRPRIKVDDGAKQERHFMIHYPNADPRGEPIAVHFQSAEGNGGKNK